MITDSGIYIGLFPNGKGYIGQAKNVEERLTEEIRGAFLGGREYGKELSEEIRRHGLKPVKISIFTGANYGIPADLFNLFRTAMLTHDGSQLPDLDIAEILYILKATQTQSGYAALNAQMGGQNSIAQIRQSNGVIIPSLLSRSASPQDAYNRFAVADVRQANINAYMDKFYEAIFSNRWADYMSYINQQEREIPINNPNLFTLSGPDFVAQYVVPHISVWSTNGNDMKAVQSQLKEGVIDKMTAICVFLPGYLNQDRKTLNADAKRDFDWASRNIYSGLSNFDSDVSKDIRESLHRIIGSILTAAKYEYNGTHKNKGLAAGIAKEFFKNINNNKDKLAKALQDALTNQFKGKLQNSLTQAIRLTNNKLKPDSAGWLAFEQGQPSFLFETPETFFQNQTRTIFNIKMKKALGRRNVLNRVDKTMFTAIDAGFTTTDSEHGRFYRKENNAIRMNGLESDDQLYTAVREEYKDTKFYHSGFKFYRPLISWWRLNERQYPPFDIFTMEHISDGEEQGKREGILSQTGGTYYFLYRCTRLLDPPLDLEDY